MIRRLFRFDAMRLLRFAAFLALAGLAIMVWSLVDPRPVPFMVAMSIGQALGTLSFLLFAVVVIAVAGRASRRASRATAVPKEAGAAEE